MAQKAEFTVNQIGVVHCGMHTPSEAPKNYTESSEIGTLEILPEYREAMDGLEVGQKVLVLFWLHEARRDALKVYPRGDRSRGLRGIFTTRSPMRPNPIAVSELTVLKLEENRITVLGVDVIDGTPILDIKSAGGGESHRR